MKKIFLTTRNNKVPILIGNDIITSKLLSTHIKSKNVIIITNETIGKIYLKKIKNCFKRYNTQVLEIKDGEKYKNISIFTKIHDHLIRNRFDRDLTIVALGGGVIGDLVGFVASTFMRGVKLIHLPTTLLAQVDSSIGGKTAVNHPNGKNLIGTFYQPDSIIIDTKFLQTLPEEEYTSGLAEVVKYGLISKPSLLVWMNKNSKKILSKNKDCLSYIVSISAKEKVRFVSQDERESNVRAFLNYGHTLGHAIEAAMNYRNILHGQAISIGMLFASMLSVEKNMLDINDFNLIEDTLEKLNLPTEIPKRIKTRDIVKHIKFDKKKQNNRNRFVLLNKLGKCVINDKLTDNFLGNMIEHYRSQ